MKITRHFTTTALALICGFLAIAQEESQPAKDKIEVKAGVYYNTGLNYYGRTDSLRSSGFFPLLEFWVNSKFYMNAAPVFVMNSETPFDYAGTVTSIGYRTSDTRSAFNIYFVKPFYEKSSQLVQSALKGQAAASYSWLNKILNITAGGDVKFSDKTDFGVSGGIDHLIRKEWGGPAVFVIDPMATINAGTQQFTKTYYKQSSFLFFPGVDQTVTEKVSNFNILSYEFSMAMVYAKGKMQLIFTPAYVIPQNLVTVANRPDLSERGRNMFYATLGAKIIL
ncbi:MAG TPA: hypothetical protein VLJ68_02455 [Chitinophagaceae bacterium]|nr:hypothetical protein [Chitinophagaceae bacterium]